ncbi:MAG: hypothetical protein COC00_008115 [Rhizobiales bacterium]|nr:hypothetical protein [Hyphomicrobiales bacterium]
MLKLGIPLVKSRENILSNSQKLRGAQVLHRKSFELSSLARKSPITKSKQLIGALLSHAARTRRATKEPVTIRLRVYTPNGNRAVQFCYK